MAATIGHKKVIAFFDEFDKVHGIKPKLRQLCHMPNEILETIVDCYTQALKDHGLFIKCTLSWQYEYKFWINWSKNVFHDFKDELKKGLVDVGFPAHILYNCIQHVADTLSVDIMNTYNYFIIYI